MNLREVLDSLYPVDSASHARSNIATLEAGIRQAPQHDPCVPLALHTLGWQRYYLRDFRSAAVDFGAAANCADATRVQRMHALQMKMTSLASAGDSGAALGQIDLVVGAAKGLKEDGIVSPAALLLGAEWSRKAYAGSPDVSNRVVAAYKKYLKVSAERGYEWPKWDAQAFAGLEHSLRLAGRYRESEAVCHQFLVRYPHHSEAVYIALEQARAHNAGSRVNADQLRSILATYPTPCSYRCVVLTQYAESLLSQQPLSAESKRTAELSLREAFSYERQPSDEFYQPQAISQAGVLLAKLLDQNKDLAGEAAVLSQVKLRFPKDPYVQRDLHSIFATSPATSGSNLAAVLAFCGVLVLVAGIAATLARRSRQ